MSKQLKCIYTFIIPAVLFAACKQPAPEETAPENIETITPVTVTHPVKQAMSETIDVNAISAFLLKTYAKATANGYLQSVNVHIGDFVKRGQVLFSIQTKEAAALGNIINSLDTSLHFQGTIKVTAPSNGYITQLTYTAGNYVQDGEQLAEITDSKSFVFLLDLPYELKKYLPLNRNLQLYLPDSTVFQGRIQSSLPVVDSVSQTQRLVISTNSTKLIPENLIAKVRLVKKLQPNSTTLPRGAVLTDETQTEFWIMQLINDSTAVKIPIRKGIESAEAIEIVSPALADSARILTSGNYGLPDTARVTINTTVSN
ncbi:MAG TPA: efflux RND transporter periplasmic adaptor subunit [Chitinophagaceae bacterium]|jgi:multidrug efflux pump subunit AcrA (membrane-fusion protein)|nr:efflux RND transporter periplasmic adaptor subunit [Chitinophagaceae bacterium]